MDDRFLKKTIEIWQPFYDKKELTLEDARQITQNVDTFFLLLQKWSNNEKDEK